jgi:uncharacterized protein YndB with AHSA1/START domain
MPAAKAGNASTGTGTTMTLPSDREILITRTFDAPRKLVFDAVTRCEHVGRWYGPRGTEMLSCTIDLRPGGAWRFVQRGPDGNEYAFSGVYREIVRPERIVQTWNFEGIPPGHESVETLTLEDLDGKTKWTTHVLFRSMEDRDGLIQSGMEPGMRETMDRLAELLESMA